MFGCEDLLDGLVQTIRAVRHHQGGSAGNHSVVVVVEVLLRRLQEVEMKSINNCELRAVMTDLVLLTALADIPGVS